MHRIYRGQQGKLWFAGLSGDHRRESARNPGAFVYENGEIHRWEHSDGLPHQRVYAITEVPDGTIWFGTYNGIGKWKNGEWKHLAQHPRAGWRYVRSIARHSDGNVYFGMDISTARGLGVIDKYDSVRYIDPSQGLPSDQVREVKTDSSGRLWITTTNGLACLSNGHWLVFNQNIGMKSSDLWPIFPSDDGLYIGTTASGWAVLDISRLQLYPPRLVIDKPVVEHDRTLIRWTPYTYMGNCPPENILTRYRIDLDEWSAWSREHRFERHNLAYGTHRLQVQAKGTYGQFAEAGLERVFNVPLPPLLRWYILGPLMILTLSLLLIGAMYYFRKRQLRLEIRNSEERYRLTTELMSDYAFLYSISEDGVWELAWMTDSFSRLTGYSVKEFSHRGFLRSYIHPEDIGIMVENRKKLLEGRRVHSEYRIYTQDRRMLWLVSDATPVADEESGRIVQVYGIARNNTMHKADEERMKSLAGELVQTEERERRRMATYLHDGISQSIALALMKLQNWQKREKKDEQMLDEVRDTLRGAIQDAHTLTFDLCPPIVHELNLAEALEWQIERMRKEYDLRIVTGFNGIDIRIAPELHVLLFRATRELIINAIKHAQASQVTVEIDPSVDGVKINVNDDGIGFARSASLKDGNGKSTARREGGFGLHNIQERLSDFSTKVHVQSDPERGSIVSLLVPWIMVESLEDTTTGQKSPLSVLSLTKDKGSTS